MQSGVSPSTLITVAAITAVSSLAASAITAVIAYVISKRNLAHAADMAAIDRATRLNEQHRTARRDAYAAYLTSVLTTLRDATLMQRQGGYTTTEEWRAASITARDAYNAAVITLGVVKMEAPGPLADRAEELRNCAHEFLKAAREAARPDMNEEERQGLLEAAESKSDEAFEILAVCTEEARADLSH
ncbi:hypothetical protein [Streptomyces sviceus]|uniref:hypothetical protein n=1 Tax=Streptomyces sviceus TaxID=285530 RepID=UPI00332B1D64